MNEAKHHWPEEQCYYCGKPATKLCDGVNSWLSDQGKILVNHPDVMDSCDRPLCGDHAEQAGMSTAGGYVDSIDYCPQHALKEKLGETPELKQIEQR